MLLFLVLAYAAVALAAFLLAERILFQPPHPSYAAGELVVRRIPVGDADSIAIAHLPKPGARLTILHSHGNAEDLGHVLPFLEELRERGFAVASYDYRGYGLSDGGRPTARKAVEDAEAALRFVVQEIGTPEDRVILHGRSLGSGPTLALAARRPVAGVVLESAFTSPYRVVTRYGILPFDRFPNVRRLRGVRCPVLVIHGTRDGVVPFSHGRALFAAAPRPKRSLWVEGAGHNDLVEVAGERYWEALAGFARLIDRAPAGPD